MKTIEIGDQIPELDPESLGWWVDVMKRQHMLSGNPIDVSRLIVK